jgi:hypothetical protein
MGAVQAKVPGQLEAGQARFHLQKNYLEKTVRGIFLSFGSEFLSLL